MSSLHKVVKNSGIYSFVTFLQKSTAFLLLPLYTAYLTPTDYGIVGMVNAVAGFLSIVTLLALPGAANRFYFDSKDEPKSLRQLWGTLLASSWLNTVCIVAILLVGGEFILAPVLGDIPMFPYMTLGLITVALSPPFAMHQTTLQSRQEGLQFGRNNLFFFLITLTATIIFVVPLHMGATGVLAAATVSTAVFCLVSLLQFGRSIEWRIHLPVLKKSLAYSLPLVPHSVAGWTMAMIDKVFLNAMVNTASVGLYNVGFQFGNILNIITNAVNLAYVPWFFENMKEGDAGKVRIHRFAVAAITGYGLLALSISLFSEEVIRIMTSDAFHSGWKIAPFIAFAYAFNGLYYFFTNILFYEPQLTRMVPLGTIPASLINVVLNILLIPFWGPVGAAAASTISRISACFLVHYLAWRSTSVPLPALRLYATMTVFSLLACLAFTGPLFPSAATFFAVKVTFFAVVTLTIFKVYGRELNTLREAIRGRAKTKNGVLF